ncbi:hypothetical protein Dimus_027041 [Dionaea muscipula]
MDPTYMDYLLTRKLVNLPRVIIRHMAYIINVPHHEFPYGELLTRVFEAFEVSLDDKEGEEPVKTNHYDETFLNMCQLKRENRVWWLGSGENRRRDEIEEEAASEERDEWKNSLMLWKKRGPRPTSEDVSAPTAQANVQQKGKTKTIGVDPLGSLPDYDLLHLHVNFARALQAKSRFQELLQQVKPRTSTSPKA